MGGGGRRLRKGFEAWKRSQERIAGHRDSKVRHNLITGCMTEYFCKMKNNDENDLDDM